MWRAQLVILMTLTFSQCASANPWQVDLANGLRLQVAERSALSREGYFLERTYPGGEPDPTYGSGGRTLFRLGPDNDGPTVLKADAQGRAWVGGSSFDAGSRRAVVMRFTDQGMPDASYAQGGRSATGPAGAQARVSDLLPMPDGSAWVAGMVVEASGNEHSGWWRLLPDGRVDPQFGIGGLWQDNQPGVAEPMSLTLGADGSVALVLQRQGDAARQELWVQAPGASAPQRVATRVGASQTDAPIWRQGWQWTGAQPAPAAANPTTGDSPDMPTWPSRAPAPALEASNTADTDAQTVPSELGWAAGIVALLAVGGWASRKFRMSADDDKRKP